MADRFSKTMNVEGVPFIKISNDMGKINVHSGMENQVIVNGELQRFQCAVEQQGNSIKISSRANHQWYEWFFLWIEFILRGWPKCNLDITVPAHSDIDIESKTGSVEISGLRGIMKVYNSTGSIRTRDTNGNIKMRTATGSVALSNVQGEIETEASTGEVRLENAEGRITARSSTGSIHFNGSLSPHQEHRFETSTGSIHLSLKKPDVAFSASVGTGSIHCYPDAAITHRDRHMAEGHFGNGTGKVTVRTGTGSIHIQG